MRKSPKKKTNKTKGTAASTFNASNNDDDGSFLWVDPSRVRFQHSRIRPYFSGCGRSVMATLEAIRNHQVDPIYDLPPIQVLVRLPPTTTTTTTGSSDNEDDGVWYFSLNNRRLWVLKECWQEGLLQEYNHRIRVRVRSPKSQAELERYTVQNCALHAKLMRESVPSNHNNHRKNRASKKDKTKDSTTIETPELSASRVPDFCWAKKKDEMDTGMSVIGSDQNDEEDSDSSCCNDGSVLSNNRFTALL